MDLKGEYRIPAPRERVWAMLNDADVLRDCIPGCESLEPDGDDGFKAKVTTRIGPVKATFNGAVTLSDLKPPEHYTISGEGKGGAAGFASGSADVDLAEEGAETVLTYTANAKVGGKLAQLGSRLVDSTARKMADQFFDRFAERASAPEGAAAAEGGPAATTRTRVEPTVPLPDAGEPVEPTVPPPSSAPAARAEPASSAARREPAATPAPEAELAPPAEGPVRASSQTTEPVGGGVSGVAHDVAEAAYHAEEELEKQAAAGVLGGPWFWGLIVLAAIILFYLFAA